MHRCHTVADMVDVYEAKVLSHTQYAAVYDSCASVGRIQRGCLKTIGVDEFIAFMKLNFAPLDLRRGHCYAGPDS